MIKTALLKEAHDWQFSCWFQAAVFAPANVFLRVIKRPENERERAAVDSHAWGLSLLSLATCPFSPCSGRCNLSWGDFSLKLPQWEHSQWCSDSTTACLAAERACCSYYAALGKISVWERMDFKWWMQNWLGRRSVVMLSNISHPCFHASLLIFCPARS